MTTTPFTTRGEIVSWNIRPGTRVKYAAVVAALQAAGLDDKVAREMQPRNAFSRAVKRLQEARIIRRVNESPAELRFQFTAEQRDGNELRYSKEAVLVLDKRAGTVTAETAGADHLAAQAQAAIADESQMRFVADITCIVQRLFQLNADLFPVRDGGGCYFVPATFAPFLRQIEAFMAAVDGTLRRYPVAGGDPAGDRSIAESVEEGMAKVIMEHLTAIKEMTPETRDSTLEKTVKRIQATGFKVEAYADFLGEKREALLACLQEAREELATKVAELGRAVEVTGVERVTAAAEAA